MIETKPDQGFAWAILGVTFVYNIIEASVYMSSAVYMIDWLWLYGITKAEVGFASSLMNAVNYFTAFLATGPLIDRLGCRVVGCLGALILSGGFLTCALVQSIAGLYVGYGIIAGIGIGLMSNPSIIIIQHYFNKKRAFATGISLCGHSVGSFIMLPLLRLLIRMYSIRAAIVLHACIVMQNIVLASMFRPNNISKLETQCETNIESECESYIGNQSYSAHMEQDDEDNGLCETDTMENNPELSSLMDCKEKHSTNINEHKKESYADKNTLCHSLFQHLNDILDFRLLRNISFVLFITAEMLNEYGTGLMYRFTSVKAVAGSDIDPVSASWLPSMTGLCSTISRVITSVVANLPSVNRTLLLGISTFVQGVIIALSCTASSLEVYLVFMGLFGITTGMFFTLTNSVLVDLVGVSKVAQGKSFSSLFIMTAVIISLPLAGGIIDATHNYDIPYYIYGGLCVVGGVLLAVVYVLNR